MAFAGNGYSNSGSWFYPNGKYAFVSGSFSDANTWYYPNGNVFVQNGRQSPDGEQLVRVVDLFDSTRFNCGYLEWLPRELQVITRLIWVESQITAN